MAQVVSNLQLFVYHCSNIYNSLGFRACCFLAAIRSQSCVVIRGERINFTVARSTTFKLAVL